MGVSSLACGHGVSQAGVMAAGLCRFRMSIARFDFDDALDLARHFADSSVCGAICYGQV